MVSTDPISDMLTRIRNAIAVRKNEVTVPYSAIKQTIAELLQKQGFLTSVTVSGNGINKTINIIINESNQNAVITEIKRISRPGRRLYAKSDEIPVIKRGRGLVIISTSQGIMTGSEAKAKRLGGELLCSVI